MELFKNNGKSYSEFDGSMIAMLLRQKDFDADLKCPTFNEEYTGQEYMSETKPRLYSPSEGKPPQYARRLEDIDSTWIESYLGNVIYGIFHNSSVSVLEYNKNHPMLRFMVDDEDDEILSEADMMLEYSDDYSPEEIAKAKEKIPYLLRRLHDKSKQLKIHVISLMIAHEKAKRFVNIENRRRNGRKIQLAARHLLATPIYKMNPNGTLGAMLGSDANNTEASFKEAKEWIFKSEDKYDEYYDDMVALLHYYDVMGIDITKEDPAVYQEDYISALTVLYITSNREYVSRKRTGFHKEVFEALKRIPLENFEEGSEEEEIDMYVRIENTMHIFNDSVFLPTEVKNRLNMLEPSERAKLDERKNVFTAYYNIMYGTLLDNTKMISDKGFLFVDTETPLTLDITLLLKEEDKGYVDNLVLFHENGYLVRLSNSNQTTYIDIEDVLEVLESYVSNHSFSTIASNDWIEVRV